METRVHLTNLTNYVGTHLDILVKDKVSMKDGSHLVLFEIYMSFCMSIKAQYEFHGVMKICLSNLYRMLLLTK